MHMVQNIKSVKDMYLIYPKDDEVSESHYHYFSKDDNPCESNQGLNLKVLFFNLTIDFNNYKFTLE